MDEKLREIREFVENIAREMNESERDGGLTWEEACPIINEWIQQARTLTGINPGYEIVFCSFCQGTIESCECGESEQQKQTSGQETENTICPRCGAVVADQEVHRAWHRNWNDWELEDLATTLPAPYSSPN